MLELIDKYLAFNLRLIYIQTHKLSSDQKITFRRLNYYWWLLRAKERFELYRYIEVTCENLAIPMRNMRTYADGDFTYVDLG